ncbi:hypothetical protein [uncultured Methylobacterium sp.]|uniref:hypothetical protein n=1 Tax=uncultured Methylobacterium sp. TaxID=157278 RepID=UPI002593B5DF|nr:hypothetical protein [uncultured Methylobacterium sp.]
MRAYILALNGEAFRAQSANEIVHHAKSIDGYGGRTRPRFVYFIRGHTHHIDTSTGINSKQRWSTPLLDVKGLH